MSTITRRGAITMIGAAALSMPYVRRAMAEDAVVNVYNWADYIGETTIEDFQKATGVKVTYDTYSSAEEMQAKLLAGKTGYDVCDMSGLTMPRFIEAKIFQKLDRSKLPSWGNLDPVVLRMMAADDPDNLYAVPYMWGSVGITLNVDMVKARLPDADLESLDLLFKPENAAKLADCGISILDTQEDVIKIALRYLGKDGDTPDVGDYKLVAELFKPIRQYIRVFDNTNFLNAIPNKELCVIQSWSGDYATASKRAKEANIDINLRYFVPKTGAPAWCDGLCIPADAPHADNAHKFLEYMLQPEVIAKCTDLTNYANGNAASKKFIKPEILNNPAIYPDEATMKRLWVPKPTSEEQDREMTHIFQQIKAG